jgi:hypothetical protein
MRANAIRLYKFIVKLTDLLLIFTTRSDTIIHDGKGLR